MTNLFVGIGGRLFEEPPEGKWYNLGTGRVVSKCPTKSGYLLHDHPRVTGTQEDVSRFMRINRLEKMKDPGSLPPSPFNLAGLETIGKALRVVDGDTVNLAIFVPLEFAFNRNMMIFAASPDAICSTCPLGGVWMYFRTRLIGVDVAEKHTNAGKEVKQRVEERLPEGIKVKVKCGAGTDSYDKYGRLLVKLYDEMGCVNDWLLSDFTEEMVRSYDGGKKPFALK